MKVARVRASDAPRPPVAGGFSVTGSERRFQAAMVSSRDPVSRGQASRIGSAVNTAAGQCSVDAGAPSFIATAVPW
jgi:hypothetical protein